MRLTAHPRQLVQSILYRDGTSIFSVLQVGDFRNLWLGQIVSFVGDALAYNTMTFAIIHMADEAGVSSGRLLSALFVLSALPSLLLGMIAGTIVDRANRKTIMIGADILRGFLALGFLFVHNLDQIWIFISVSIALSSVSIFFYPARTALLPIILHKDQLLIANALAQLTVTLSFVVGAALAGIMVGMADATAPAFVADSLSFFVSAWFIARISISGKIARRTPAATSDAHAAGGSLVRSVKSLQQTLHTMMAELLVGLRYVFTDQIMRGVLISFLALMLGLGAANVTFIPLLVDELGMPEEGLGPIRFSQTIGIILGSAPNQDLLSEINELKPGEVIMQDLVFVAGCLNREEINEFEGLPPRDYFHKKARAEFNYIGKLWHLYRTNGIELEFDFQIVTRGRKSAVVSSTNNLIQPENIFVEEGAELEYVTLNANPGSIYIGKNALIMEGSLIRGSLALCEGSRLKLGTRIYGPTTIGPYCKAGGEITNSVMMGYSNKVHDGYMGNSVLGEYCNIGAGSNTSNLKNNYALVKVWNYALGKFEDTDLQFCGLIMGDYSRCGISTMFNTGTVVGICSNIYGTGYPGNFIPSFTWGGASGFEIYRLDKAIETIRKGMSLHQKDFGETDSKIIDSLFALTGLYRKSL